MTSEKVSFTRHPNVIVKEYVVRPTGFDENPAYLSDKMDYCLVVHDGGKWGWSIQRGEGYRSGAMMNRKGKFIYEHRGSEANRFRRYELEEALALALKYVDKLTNMGMTFEQLGEWFVKRTAEIEAEEKRRAVSE